MGSSNHMQLFFLIAGDALARRGTCGQGGSVEQCRAHVKESSILMDLASKPTILKFSELINNGRKQTPALKRAKII